MALLILGVPLEVVAATGGWTSVAFLLDWRKGCSDHPLKYIFSAYIRLDGRRAVRSQIRL